VGLKNSCTTDAGMVLEVKTTYYRDLQTATVSLK
jgi:hypothetical protein